MSEFDAFASDLAAEETTRKRQLSEATSLGAATTFEPAAPAISTVPGLPSPSGSILTPQAPSEFAGFAEDLAGEENDKVSMGLRLAAQHDPETYAAARQIADRDGLPVDFALDNLPELQKRETVSKMRAALEANPGLREWFKQGDNGAQVKLDELDHLSGLTWLFQSGGAAWSEGARQTRLAEIGAAELAGRATPEMSAEGDRLDRASRSGFGADGWLDGGWTAAMQMGPIMASSALAGFKGAAVGGAVGAGIGGLSGALAGGVGALPGAAAGLTIGAKSGAVGAVGLNAYQLEAGLAFREFRAIRSEDGKALDPNAARLAAMMSGAVNAGLETFSLGTLVATIPALKVLGLEEATKLFSRGGMKEALKRPVFRDALTAAAAQIFKSGATEITTEMAQEGMTIFGGELAKLASDGDFKFLTPGEWAARVGEAGVETAKAMTIMGPLFASPKFMADVSAARRADKTVAIFTQINEAVKEHDLKTRNPEANKSAVEAAMQGQGVEKVFVPVERLNELFQSLDMTADDLAGFDGFSESYSEAVMTGGDVEIRFSDFHTRIAGTPLGEAIVPHLRLNAEDMTASEARDFNEAWQETRVKLMEQDIDNLKAEAARAGPGEAVFQDVKDKAIAAGRSADVATQYATVWQAFFSTLAEKTGGDAKALYDERGVEIKFAFPEALSYQKIDDLDVLFDDLRAGREVAVDRERKKALGPSLSTFLRSKGGVEDSGGELAARDVGGALLAKPGKGMNLDDAAMAAWEAGYFPQFTERPSIDDLLAALDTELAGGGVYRDGLTPEAVDLSSEYLTRLDTLGRTLSELGLSPEALSNAELRGELEAAINANPEQDALFQFAGIGGATRFMENAGMNVAKMGIPSLQEAVRLEQAGEWRDDIFERTGWFRGVDDLWRFEISDADATVKLDAFSLADEDGRRTFEGRLADALDHPVLYGAYPALADVPVMLAIGDKEGGVFDPNDGTMEAYGPDEATMRSVLLHEIAHFIQTEEGFAPGGNLSMGEIYEGERVELWKSEVERLGSELQKSSVAADGSDLSSQFQTAQERLTRAAQYEYYRRIAGEVEARNVQTRDEMIARGEDPDVPWWTQDVPDGQQIVISRTEDHGEAFAMVSPPAVTETPAFKEWFGDSKVVDKDGNPLVVYHGTAADIETFDIEKSDSGDGIYFTPLTEYAGRYAEMRGRNNGGGANVMPVFLSIKNPMEIPPSGGGPSFWIGRAKALGHDGLVVLDEDGQVRVAVAFEATQIKSVNNRGSFDPADPRILYQGNSDLGGPRADKRGSIQFGQGQTIINLFEKADLSTFLHETGHFFLEVTRDMALRDGAPDVLASDWAAIKEWLGLADDKVTIEAHEQFARGFEAYLFEGKAPNEQLRSAFARFKSWLTFIYRKIARLNVELTPEIRAVFDRMLASEEDIAATANAQAFRGWMDAASADMSQPEFEAYRALADKATAQAKEDYTARLLADVKRETTREWQENKKIVRAEVLAEFSTMPVYQVTHYLRTGQALAEGGSVPAGRMALDRAWLVDRYGTSGLSRLPRYVPPIYADAATNKRKDVAIVHPDILAELFGYPSGDALVQDLFSAPPMARAVVEETNLRMRDRYGDLMNDQAQRSVEAVTAMQNDPRAQFIETELKVLTRRGGNANPMPRQVAAAMARDIIAAKKVAEATRVGSYTKQIERAAKDAEAAMLAGDFKAAAEHKRRQLFSHYLAQEARRAKEEVEAATRYLNRFGNRKRPASVDPEYLDQIEAMLERFDLRRGTSLKAIERRKALSAFIAEKEAAGEIIQIPEYLRDEAKTQSYKDLVMDDLRALTDSVKNIEHLGRLKNKLILNRKAIDFRNVKDELIAAGLANTEARKKIKGFNPNRWEALNLRVLGIGATMARIEQVIEWLDGGDINGPWRRFLWAPMAEAQSREAVMREKVMGPLLASWEGLPKGYLAEKVHFASVGRSLSRSEIFALALNTGTESNRAKLLAGEKIREGGGVDSEGKLADVLATMTKADWDIVQTIWDQINSLWPDASALEKRQSGLTPEKVEAREFTNEHGTYRGGYYPLVYDDAQAIDVASRLMSDEALKMDPQFARLSRENGYLKSRVENYARPLSTRLDAMTRHIDKVIHDITHWEAVRETNRLLNDPEIATMIRDQLGAPFRKEFDKWLKRVWFGDDLSGSSDFQAWISKLRTNAGIYSLAYRFTTVVTQFAGFGPSAARVGVLPLASAMKSYWMAGPSNPFEGGRRNAVEEFVTSKSTEMKNRASAINRDIRLGLAKLEGKSGILQDTQRWGFLGIAMADRWVSIPTWLAGYNKQLELVPGDEAGAIEAGDRAVRLSQGSGGTKDISSIQADPNMQPFTMFYGPFNVLFNNLWSLGRDTGRLRRDGGSAADYADVIMRALFFVAIPAVMADLLSGRGPSEEDKEEEGRARAYATWAAGKVALYPFATIPLVRDAVSAFDLGFDTNAAPAGRLANSSAKMASGFYDLARGEPVKARTLTKNTADTLGLIMGLPIGQAVSSGNNVWKGVETGDLKAADFVFSRNR